MIALDKALSIILRSVPRCGEEEVPVRRCAGRVLRRTLRAREDSPRFDNSSMDGYALRSRDCAARLRLVGSVPAGSARPARLLPGTAVRILTGAPIPPGADAVVKQEDVRAQGGSLVLGSPVPRGENVRRAGEDVRKGQILLEKGRVLGPLETALLSAQGFSRVAVSRRPVVAIVCTGDELRRSAGPLRPGLIRDGNGPGLEAGVLSAGAEPLPLGPVRDDGRLLERAFRRALESADMLLVSGGVSVGDRDLTRATLERLDMRTLFWRVAIKPGKPLLFGMTGRVPVFGLPGNPLSTWIGFEEFVRPALHAMMGRSPERRWENIGLAEKAFPLPADRRQFVFCRARGPRLEPIEGQNSGMISMACRADAVALSPEGADRIRRGDRLRFRWI
ncbi:MAG: gephyrin-like molybdotransferase Glp [Elusimicrobiota bacterium]